MLRFLSHRRLRLNLAGLRLNPPGLRLNPQRPQNNSRIRPKGGVDRKPRSRLNVGED